MNEDVERLTLFEGDPFNRLLEVARLSGAGKLRLLLRIVVAAGVTWAPTAMLAWMSHVALRAEAPAASFLRDVSAYVEFLIVLPLLLAAEPYLADHLSALPIYLLRAGIVPAKRQKDLGA